MPRLSCLLAMLLCCCLSACHRVSMPICPATGSVLSFEQAVNDLAKGLEGQIVESRNPFEKIKNRVKTIVFDPFIDSKNAQELGVNTQILQILSRSFSSNIRLVPLTVENLQQAEMVLTGILMLDDNPSAPSGKAYHLYASLLTLRDGYVRARICTWCQSVDLEPLAIGQETPVYLRDVYLRNQVAAAKAEDPYYSHWAFINHLQTRAMLHHAYRTFESGDYQSTLAQLDLIALTRPDGVAMATYSAMYVTHVALDDIEGARQPLAKLFNLGVEDEKLIGVRLLFEVNAETLINKSERQAQEYSLWLQEISKIVKDKGICLQIEGHCSRTGTAQYNEALSLRRARTVQKIMVSHYKELNQRTRVVGKGFSENVVGSGTDDIQDMIDRRVEFKIVGCGAK